MGKKVSWRTLARRAERATPIEAKKLRSRAASLRRAERKVSIIPTSDKRLAPGTKITHARKATRSESAQAAWAVRKAKGARVPYKDLPQVAAASAEERAHIADVERIPGRGEIVGGEVLQLADKISKLARKRGGTDAIQSELNGLAAVSDFRAASRVRERAEREAIQLEKAHAGRIVCSFLAEIAGIVSHNGGSMPTSLVISGLTAAKITDALRDAGYRENGAQPFQK